MTTYIGIDIAKASFALVILRSNGGFDDYTLPNDKTGFARLRGLLPTNSHCMLEALGPYYLPIALFLTQHQLALSVVNPLVVRRF